MNEDMEREEGTQETEAEAQEMNMDDLLEEPQGEAEEEIEEEEAAPEAEEEDEQGEGPEGEETNGAEETPPAARQETPPTAAQEKGAFDQAKMVEQMKIVQSVAGYETAKMFLQDPTAREALLSGADVYAAFARYRERAEKTGKPRHGVPTTRQSGARTAKRSVASLSDEQFDKAFEDALYEAQCGKKVVFD